MSEAQQQPRDRSRSPRSKVSTTPSQGSAGSVDATPPLAKSIVAKLAEHDTSSVKKRKRVVDDLEDDLD